MGRVEGEHRAQQVLQLCRKLALLLVGAPELVKVVERDELVEAVVGSGGDEGRVGRNQDEERDPGRKEVVHDAVVVLAHEQLWGLKGIGAADGLGLVVVGELGGESEVRDLDVVAGVEEDVLRLDVAVDDVGGVQVAQGAYHLVEERPRDGLVERAELQDLAQVVRSVLEHQPRTGFRLSRLLVGCVLDALVEFDDVRVVELSEYAGLLLEDGGEHLRGVGVVLGGKLDGIQLPVAGGQFDST